jgi:Acetyltransferase (GNAT) domain
MQVKLIENEDQLAEFYMRIKRFVDDTKPKYCSHIIDALLEWFRSFGSRDNDAFIGRRGINFLGRNSKLCSLFFLLVYDEQQVRAFAPLFRFKVDLGEGVEDYEVLSFCPDSTIFFYNDILIEPNFEERALDVLLEFFRKYNRPKPFVVLFNHLPSSSRTLPLLLERSMDLMSDGFRVSVSSVFWRGGLYPWNLGKLLAILENAERDLELSETTRKNIGATISEIRAANRTMLIFRSNHAPLKSSIYRIFEKCKPSGSLLDLYNALEEVFQSHPVKYPYIKLPESKEVFVNSLSSSKRYYYERYRKRFLSNNGQFVKIHGDAIVDQDIQDFISLHRERWGNNSNILNRLTAPFLQSFLKKLSLDGLLTLFFASYESRRVACLCCIDFSGRREFLSSGRSVSDQNLRAGKLLLYEGIVDSIDEGLRLFDFGYGDEAYKADFNWSFLTTNVVALFHKEQPRQFSNIFSVYEELFL